MLTHDDVLVAFVNVDVVVVGGKEKLLFLHNKTSERFYLIFKWIEKSLHYKINSKYGQSKK